MNRIKASILTLALLSTVVVGVISLPSAVYGLNVYQACDKTTDPLCSSVKTDSATSLFHAIVNTLLLVLGSIAVIMIIIGGIRYTTSNGEAANTKAAKDTILYSVVGLVVALMAYAIVNFVVTQFK